MTLHALLAGLAAAAALAGAAPAGEPAKPAKKPPAAAPRKVLKLEELKVEGRIQKPQAVFLLPRANPDLGELDPQESLLPKIGRAAEKEPFQ